MVFMCQTDSFLREFSTKIVQITPKEEKLYEVICEDTVLFPEGGGQTHDTGFINDYRVVNVIRKGALAIHTVESETVPDLKENDEIIQKVDWERRKDHMQQHSGQHLISALFENVFDFQTKSWWLGTETSYIEFDPQLEVTEEKIRQIEKMANSYIFEARPVTVQLFNSREEIDKADTSLLRATKSLPDDHVGAIRLINIEGIDKNPCCGTHVSNLNQLQVVKLLHLEKPSKNKQLLHFLVGDRVIKKLQSCYDRELTFNQILNGGPASHVDLLEKMRAALKRNQKAVKMLSKESAQLEAIQYKAVVPPPAYYIITKAAEQCESGEFVNTLSRELKDALKTTCIIIVIEEKPSSQLFIYGGQKLLEKIGNDICEVLEAKIPTTGIKASDRFQTKFFNLKGVSKLKIMLKDHFSAENQK